MEWMKEAYRKRYPRLSQKTSSQLLPNILHFNRRWSRIVTYNTTTFQAGILQSQMLVFYNPQWLLRKTHLFCRTQKLLHPFRRCAQSLLDEYTFRNGLIWAQTYQWLSPELVCLTKSQFCNRFGNHQVSMPLNAHGLSFRLPCSKFVRKGLVRKASKLKATWVWVCHVDG